MALTGCTTPEPPEPTPTPLFSSEEEAFAAAEATYRAYVDALNQVDLSNPETFEPVYDLTTGEANADFRESFSNMHAEGMVVTGSSTISALEPLAIDSDFEAAELAVCLDVSQVQVVDSTGASAVDPDRVPVQSLKILLSPTSESSFGWAIEEISGRNGEPGCG
nr:hypothetical protein [Microbacterium yannicii]